ncbi:unnamed protein product [Pleuronectes platessa]|uniref:Uncharacterized protein n=1 Tax=Pleuronectes platessa TaxID=8262 RepID=A0A9N7Z8J1_PLEPL|nr:unnamed protein product [Pleuronectes platessa]
MNDKVQDERCATCTLREEKEPTSKCCSEEIEGFTLESIKGKLKAENHNEDFCPIQVKHGRVDSSSTSPLPEDPSNPGYSVCNTAVPGCAGTMKCSYWLACSSADPINAMPTLEDTGGPEHTVQGMGMDGVVSVGLSVIGVRIPSGAVEPRLACVRGGGRGALGGRVFQSQRRLGRLLHRFPASLRGRNIHALARIYQSVTYVHNLQRAAPAAFSRFSCGLSRSACQPPLATGLIFIIFLLNRSCSWANPPQEGSSATCLIHRPYAGACKPASYMTVVLRSRASEVTASLR